MGSDGQIQKGSLPVAPIHCTSCPIDQPHKTKHFLSCELGTAPVNILKKAFDGTQVWNGHMLNIYLAATGKRIKKAFKYSTSLKEKGMWACPQTTEENMLYMD